MVKVTVVGAGNCFAGLYLGLSEIKRGREVLSLLPPTVGPHPKDIDVVSAYDVDSRKIGKRLHEVVPHTLVDWPIEPLPTEAEVKPAPILDGVDPSMEKDFSPHHIEEKDWKSRIIRELEDAGTEVLVNFLPVGSEKATRFWAEVALESGIAMFNGIPSFIASEPSWARRFEKEGVPIIGDDMKSQLGATIVHKALLETIVNRGVRVLESYQLNVGGNTDFKNMLKEERLKTKRVSKTHVLRETAKSDDIYAGPSGYIPFLKNTKVAHIYIKGIHWAHMPVEIDLKLKVDDKADAAPVAMEGIRILKHALDKGIGGPLDGPSAWMMKHPPTIMEEAEAYRQVLDFLSD